jgi:hypothetical protein
MNQKSLIASVSILALFLGGCPSGEDNEPVVQSTPVRVAKKAPLKSQPTASPFATPLTAKQPGKQTAVAGLIPQLPPDARVNQVRKNLGRNDPFAAIPTVPVVIPPSPGAGGGTANRPVPVIPQLPPTRGNAGGAGGGGGNQPGTPRGTTRVAQAPRRPNVLPLPAAKKPTIKPSQTAKTPMVTNRPGGILPLPPLAVGPRELPQLQEPTLAKTIEVTGVVDAGGVPSAIVKVPNEPARSVRQGERLLNGQVLVKRIEVNSGPTPTVILEQFGQEVARQVGDKPSGTPGQPGSPTA